MKFKKDKRKIKLEKENRAKVHTAGIHANHPISILGNGKSDFSPFMRYKNGKKLAKFRILALNNDLLTLTMTSGDV